MLRKTNVNRASLRRSPTPEDRFNHNDTTNYNKTGFENSNYYGAGRGINRNNTNKYGDNVVYKSSDSPSQSSFLSKNSEISYNKNAGISLESASGYKNAYQPYSIKQTQTVTTELAPGLVMKGKVAEL